MAYQLKDNVIFRIIGDEAIGTDIGTGYNFEMNKEAYRVIENMSNIKRPRGEVKKFIGFLIKNGICENI